MRCKLPWLCQEYASISSDKGLPPVRRHAIIQKQRWFIVNWTFQNEFQWNFNRNWDTVISEHRFENVPRSKCLNATMFSISKSIVVTQWNHSNAMKIMIAPYRFSNIYTYVCVNICQIHTTAIVCVYYINITYYYAMTLFLVSQIKIKLYSRFADMAFKWISILRQNSNHLFSIGTRKWYFYVTAAGRSA